MAGGGAKQGSLSCGTSVLLDRSSRKVREQTFVRSECRKQRHRPQVQSGTPSSDSLVAKHNGTIGRLRAMMKVLIEVPRTWTNFEKGQWRLLWYARSSREGVHVSKDGKARQGWKRGAGKANGLEETGWGTATGAAHMKHSSTKMSDAMLSHANLMKVGSQLGHLLNLRRVLLEIFRRLQAFENIVCHPCYCSGFTPQRRKTS